MKAAYALAVCSVLVLLGGCTPPAGTDDSQTQAGVRVVGALIGTASAAREAPKFAVASGNYNDDPALCPDGSEGGVSASVSPASYVVALKRLTLLGDESSGTADYELFSADSVDQAYVADFTSDVTFFSSDSYPPPGIYNGLEIELFYVEMQIPMVVPAISDIEDLYTTRGYFTQVGNVLPRDVTIFSEGTEYWINRKMDDPEPFGLVPVTDPHPDQVLDLWADEAFWGRDPITISTADTSYGTGFTFRLADDSDQLVVPDDPTGLYEITFLFDVTDTFTFWEYLENGQPEDADGVFTVGFDCGYRILFPDVVISIEQVNP